MGVIVNASASNTPREAQLNGYKAAQWTAFTFGALAAILAMLFLRGVGIVGHQDQLETDKAVTFAESVSDLESRGEEPGPVNDVEMDVPSSVAGGPS